MYWVNDHIIDRIVYLAGAGTQRLGRATYDVRRPARHRRRRQRAGRRRRLPGPRGLPQVAQSGNVQLYAGGMFLGVFIFAVAFAAAA